MFLPPLHPKFVHLPLALAVLLPLLSGGVWLAWWRGWMQRRAWSIVVAAQALLVGSAVVAIRTGEADAERVEARVGDAAVERHEDAAETFAWAGGFVLALGVAALAIRRSRAALTLALATVGGSALVLGLGYRVGEAGGELVYARGAAEVWRLPGSVAPAESRQGDDDGDLHR